LVWTCRSTFGERPLRGGCGKRYGIRLGILEHHGRSFSRFGREDSGVTLLRLGGMKRSVTAAPRG
jgi:hypothetical protein